MSARIEPVPAIVPQPAAGPWIPVSERLPLGGETVIVWADTDHDHFGPDAQVWTLGECRQDEAERIGELFRDAGIRCWAPLYPPREGQL